MEMSHLFNLFSEWACVTGNDADNTRLVMTPNADIRIETNAEIHEFESVHSLIKFMLEEVL